jgi:hypothetical protein
VRIILNLLNSYSIELEIELVIMEKVTIKELFGGQPQLATPRTLSPQSVAGFLSATTTGSFLRLL